MLMPDKGNIKGMGHGVNNVNDCSDRFRWGTNNPEAIAFIPVIGVMIITVRRTAMGRTT